MQELILAMAAALLATAATAEPTRPASVRRSEYAYFHRAGASMEIHDKDVAECLKESKRFSASGGQVDTQTATGNGIGGAIGAAIAPLIFSAIHSSPVRAANFENCMVVRGWDVIAVSNDDGARLSELSQPELASRLGPLIGSAEPRGTILRTFENGPPAYEYGASAKRSLSIVAAKLQADLDPSAKPPKLPNRPATTMPPLATKIARLQLPEAGRALVIVRITAKNVPAIALIFTRIGADVDTPAWIDGQPNSFNALSGPDWRGNAKMPDLTLAFEVPVGRWAFTSSIAAVNYCYGAPAFDVQEGEVVFAGTFMADGDRLGPSMDLEPARSFLISKPEINARLKPARWINGVVLHCGDSVFGYAFEIPGADVTPISHPAITRVLG